MTSNEFDILQTIYKEVFPVDNGGYVLIDDKLYGYVNPTLDIVIEPVYVKAVYRNNYVAFFDDYSGRKVNRIVFLKNKAGVIIQEFRNKEIVVSDFVESQALDYKLVIVKVQVKEEGNTRVGAAGPTGEMVFNALTGEMLKYSPGGTYISSSYRPFNNKVVYAIEEAVDQSENSEKKKKSVKNSVITGITEDFEIDTIENILTKHYSKVEVVKGTFARYKCTDENGEEVFVNKFGQVY